MSLRKKIGRIPRPASIGEETLALHLKVEGIPFEREVKFHPERKWRFDFALPGKIAAEVEGAPGAGRHTTFTGFTNDCIKYSEAAVLGWRVLRFTTEQVRNLYALDCIKRAMGSV